MKFVIFNNHGIWCQNNVQTYNEFIYKIGLMEKMTNEKRENLWYVIGDEVVTWDVLSAMVDSLPMEKDLI